MEGVEMDEVGNPTLNQDAWIKQQKANYNNFVKSNTTFVGFSEGAVRPLINEQDPEIQQKVISSVENAGIFMYIVKWTCPLFL